MKKITGVRCDGHGAKLLNFCTVNEAEDGAYTSENMTAVGIAEQRFKEYLRI